MKAIYLAVLLVLSSWLALPVVADTSAAPASVISVNINSASAAEIAETLQGIGAAKADAIVAYREANGSFASVESLSDVSGIGAATVEKNRARISLQ